MSIQNDKRSAILRLVFFIIGSAAVFAYVYVVIEPELIYHVQGRLVTYEHFEFNMEFFENTFFSISGPVHYLSAYLTQLFYYPLVGSAIISGLCLVLCGLTYKITQGPGFLRKIPVVAFIPAILMLVSFNRYRNHTTAFISIIAATAVFLLYNKIKKRNIPTEIAVFIVLVFFLFWLSGQGCLLFSVLCALSQDNRNKLRIGVFFVVFAAAFFWVCNHLLDIYFPLSQLGFTIRDGYDRYVNDSYYLCMLTIAVAVLWGSYDNFFAREKKKNKKVTRKPHRFSAAGLLIVNVLIFSIIFYASLVPSFYKTRKHLLKVGKYSVTEQWDEVIAYCKKNPINSTHHFQLHDVNYALFKKGRLLDDMFQFEQNYKSLLLNFDGEMYLIFYRLTRTMYELGYAGLSQKFAHRLLILNGDEPEIIHWLALIYFAKDSPETATHFLNKLKKNIIYKDRAEQFLELIENGTYLNPLIGSVVDDDQINYTFNTGVFFGNLLRKNPQNKMAMDYMMAFFLLTKRSDRIVQYIPLLKGFGYDELPLAIRQGLIVQKLTTGDKLDLSNYGISESELNNAKDFFVAVNSYAFKRDPKYRAEIVDQYKGTYYYYLAFTKFN